MNSTAPYVVDSDTSREAAELIEPHLGRLETVVLQAFRDRGGLTDDETERVTGLSHQTASARRRGLVLRGLIEDGGVRRPTRSGRNAIVWMLVPPTRRDRTGILLSRRPTPGQLDELVSAMLDIDDTWAWWVWQHQVDQNTVFSCFACGADATEGAITICYHEPGCEVARVLKALGVVRHAMVGT